MRICKICGKSVHKGYEIESLKSSYCSLACIDDDMKLEDIEKLKSSSQIIQKHWGEDRPERQMSIFGGDLI